MKKHGLLILTTFILFTVSADAGPRDPFPVGHLMMSQGAIIETEGVGGRQPWVSAAFYRDTLRWGVSAAAVNYHGGGAAAQYAVGGFGVFGPATCKAALLQLDVMGVYYEQTGFLSAGTSWRFLTFGLDAHMYRIGLYGSSDDIRTMAAVGAAVLVQTTRINANAAIHGLTVFSSNSRDADPSPYITLRVCTVRNRYGSQGAVMEITPDSDAPIRFILAQEYRIGKMFAFSASIASNPTTIGFGITVDKFPLNGSAAAVNHPFLGWSRGMSADYTK